MKRKSAMAVLVTLSLTACSPPAPPQAVLPTVLVRSVGKAGGAAAMQVYTGEVRARFESDLGFRIGGKLVERRVDVGAVVRRGQVLARLDPQDAELAAAAAVAQVAAAEADVALARAELERAQGLRARNFISASALDTRSSAHDAAAARLRQARAQAATARNQAGYAELVADSDGVVTGQAAEVGQVVAVGQAVFRLARPGEREVLIHAPENRVRQLVPGVKAVVRLWSVPDQAYPGVVREVTPMADAATRTFAVRVSVPAADAALQLGATATAAFATDSADTVVLPGAALSRDAGRDVVWLVDGDGIVRPQAVDVIAYREDGAVLRANLPDAARVVVAGVHKLVAGEKVRSVEEGAPVALDVQR
ncbi:efflux transporter periplasmic adaptor subunit [Azoarcus sp. DD4]|uniref:efflux RND transporter periplasmic adaptor subunit n=1 Tax=Azoarcus sp. DD4 TaxID=2027405 RepID=UPI00112B66FA|nr:efflux RND transporter periplasmic adaptor subunit [Azoarcus sp. DD4]QDF95969.1 efflux transporter periplasmic adaptor subunit [Azoarcus sp. DD4]